MTNLDGIFKSRDITLPTKVRLVKAMYFPVVMYGCESWTVKKAEHQRTDAFWTVLLEKTLESPLDFNEIQPVHSKGDQSWVFFGRNDAEAETPVLWPPHAKSWLIGKDSDAGRDWGQEEKKGTTEDEMAGWHHWLNRHESEWTLGVGDGQGGLACCDSWGRKESDTTKRLNWTELSLIFAKCSPRIYQSPEDSKWSESHSVMSDSLRPHELHSPWNSPGRNTGVGSLSLLQGIFSTQGSNPGLPHCRWILYQLSHRGSLKTLKTLPNAI